MERKFQDGQKVVMKSGRSGVVVGARLDVPMSQIRYNAKIGRWENKPGAKRVWHYTICGWSREVLEPNLKAAE